MASKQVRILADTTVDGIGYKANQVIEVDEKIVKNLEGAGAADSNKEAVAYCTTELGAKVIKHADEVAKLAKEAKAVGDEAAK